MNVRIVSKNYQPSEKLTTVIEKKLSKLDRFFFDEPTATVNLKNIKKDFTMEVSIACGGTTIRAEKSGKTFYYCIDSVLEVLEKQIVKNRNKLQKRVQLSDSLLAETVAEEEPEVVRIKRFAVKPMDVNEAMLQLELSGHDFYIFVNSATNTTNVLYKRRQGNLGLIEPEE